MAQELKDEKVMEWEALELGVAQWAKDRGLLKRENAPSQMMKVVEELGELAECIAKRKRASTTADAVGDVLVTIIILSYQLGINPQYALDLAYNEIKDRAGSTINGVFIKK